MPWVSCWNQRFNALTSGEIALFTRIEQMLARRNFIDFDTDKEYLEYLRICEYSFRMVYFNK